MLGRPDPFTNADAPPGPTVMPTTSDPIAPGEDLDATSATRFDGVP